MKIKLLPLLAFFLTINIFFACQQDPCLSKNQFIETSDNFFIQIEKVKKDLTEEQIVTFEDRYKNIVNNCYKKFKDELSQEEKQDFWIKSVKSYLKLHSGDINGLFNKDNDDPFNQYVSDEIEELIEESGDEFSSLISELIKKQIPTLIDMLLDKVGEFNEELKQNLDK